MFTRRLGGNRTVTLFCITCSVFSQAVESPWPMYQHDAEHSGRSPYAVYENPTTRWSFAAGDWILSAPSIAPDGTIYCTSLDSSLYAIGPDGSLKWSFKTAGQVLSSPALGSEGTVYFGSQDGKLYALNSDGSLKWVFNADRWIQSSPSIDTSGNVYVGSGDSSLYAIRFDGSLKWKFRTGGRVDSSPAIGADGTIYVGSFDGKLYAVNPDGSKKWDFTTNGVIIASPAVGDDGTVYVGSEDNQFYVINPDGSLKWTYTTGYFIDVSPALDVDGTVYVGSLDHKLYALNSDGSLRWTFNSGDMILTAPAIDAAGTIYVGSGPMLWMECMLYALTSEGTVRWEYEAGANVGRGFAIGSDSTLFVGSGSNLLAVGPQYSPIILSVSDVPHDQGGKVTVTWKASLLDWDVNELPYYSVWRAIPFTLLTSKSEQVSRASPIKPHEGGSRVIMKNGVSYSWEWIANQPAHRFSEYSYTVPTLYDSMAGTNGIHYVLVSAHTKDPNVFYDSSPDSGYSVDNLAPLPPQNLIGSWDGEVISLSWHRNQEADLKHYLVFRSTLPGVDPSHLEPLAVVSDTAYQDVISLSTGSLYYVIVAEDIHGNWSAKSNEYCTPPLFSRGTIKVPSQFNFSENYPNPFNPVTTVRYDVSLSSDVSLIVYDILGREVARLADQEMEPGYYQVIWDGRDVIGREVPSGIYIARLVTPEYSKSIKMVLLK
ncbi:MAG: PQQ-binding-like beta-propeller repeat protein [Candidatus Neomarinimicrobiota bacterium]